MRRVAALALLASAVLTGGVAHALTVSGRVTDSAGSGVRGIRVEVHVVDPIADTVVEVVYADVGGRYASSRIDPGDDVYVIARWEFQLVPPGFFHDRVVRVLDVGAGDPFVASTTFTPRQSRSLTNVSADVTLDVTMAERQPVDLPALVIRIQDTLDYVRTHLGGVAWNADFDVPVHVLTDKDARNSGGEVFIPAAGFQGVGATPFDIVTVYHEIAHKIHREHNGGTLPTTGPDCRDHGIFTEETPECALVEGWASYVAQLTAESLAPPVVDPLYTSYRDQGPDYPANSLWRGEEINATGRDAAGFESGERVEGAVAGVWFGIHEDVLFWPAGPAAKGFPMNLGVMVRHRPNHVFEFRGHLVAEVGSRAPAAIRLYEILQRHGIVYSRPRFTRAPFSDPQPLGAARAIRGLTFLRGTVNATFEVSRQDLGVQTDLVPGTVLVRYKPAGAGLGESPANFPAGNETPEAGFSGGQLALDTTAFGGDGAWDLLLVGRNQDGFLDDFRPTWTRNDAAGDPGDGNPTVDTEEKYLKVFGAWYDEDRNPATDPEAGGQVVVDNTPPVTRADVRTTP